MKVIGISESHCDAGCALLIDGELILAVNEERFSRKKRHRGFPYRSLSWILTEAKLNLDEIDFFSIAKATAPNDIAAYTWSLRRHYRNDEIRAKGLVLFLDKFIWFALMVPYCFFATYYLNAQIWVWALKHKIPKYKIKRVDHHSAHAYSAYFTSGFDGGLVISMDGQGFGLSSTISVAIGSNIHKIQQTLLPNSLGQFYSLVTIVCGFKPNRHEGKITGLSANGLPIAELQSFVENLITFADGKIMANAIYGHYFKARKLLKKYGKENLSYAFQKQLENIVVNYISYYFKERVHLENLVLSGGVFANVKLNQQIMTINGVKRLFVYPHMADGGSSVGAAQMLSNKPLCKALPHLYLGPNYSVDRIKASLNKSGLFYTEPKDISELVATLLVQKKIVARFDGAMEFGPRALGNRSILFSAVDNKATETLNKKLNRNDFMPFAPVTLAEQAYKCYHLIEGVDLNTRFMTITLDCTAYMREISPAVVHIDNTARPQFISKEMNEGYYNIVKAYHDITGIPSLINTSFNLHEEPIVCSPDDAIATYIKGQLDALVIGPYLIKADEQTV